MKIVFTYKDGYQQELIPKRPLTRALAEMYRIKYSSPHIDRGVVYMKRGKMSLDRYIRMLNGK